MSPTDKSDYTRGSRYEPVKSQKDRVGSGYIVSNSWMLAYYLDVVKEYCGDDIVIIETRRHWKATLSSLMRKAYGNVLKDDDCWRYYLRNKTNERCPTFLSDPPIINLLALIFAERHACQQYRDFLLTTENYKKKIEEIQANIGVEVVPFESLEKQAGKFEITERALPLWAERQLQSNEAQYWISKIEEYEIIKKED